MSQYSADQQPEHAQRRSQQGWPTFPFPAAQCNLPPGQGNGQGAQSVAMESQGWDRRISMNASNNYISHASTTLPTRSSSLNGGPSLHGYVLSNQQRHPAVFHTSGQDPRTLTMPARTSSHFSPSPVTATSPMQIERPMQSSFSPQQSPPRQISHAYTTPKRIGERSYNDTAIPPRRTPGSRVSHAASSSPPTATRQNNVVGRTPHSGPSAASLVPAAHPSRQQGLAGIPLDDGYVLKKSKFYVVGRVLHALHSEVGLNRSETASQAWTMNSYGEWIYTKTRRFVIIRLDGHSCLALPITTHEHLGVSKPGTRKSDYAVIYTGKEAPDILPGEHPGRDEQPMQPVAIKVDPDDLGAKLDPFSRINFARPYSIDFRTRVKNFGRVNPRSLNALQTQFHNVFGGGTAQVQASSSTILRNPTSEDRVAYSILVSGGMSHRRAARYVNRKSKPSELWSIGEQDDESGESTEPGDDSDGAIWSD